MEKENTEKKRLKDFQLGYLFDTDRDYPLITLKFDNHILVLDLGEYYTQLSQGLYTKQSSRELCIEETGGLTLLVDHGSMNDSFSTKIKYHHQETDDAKTILNRYFPIKVLPQEEVDSLDFT